jgi:hypothetical protein
LVLETHRKLIAAMLETNTLAMVRQPLRDEHGLRVRVTDQPVPLYGGRSLTTTARR